MKLSALAWLLQDPAQQAEILSWLMFQMVRCRASPLPCSG